MRGLLQSSLGIIRVCSETYLIQVSMSCLKSILVRTGLGAGESLEPRDAIPKVQPREGLEVGLGAGYQRTSLLQQIGDKMKSKE